MKQSEIKNQIRASSTLNFYNEIGIDIYIDECKKNYNLKKSNEISKEENLDIKLLPDQVKLNDVLTKVQNVFDLENIFKNYDGCNLKKTATNFIGFQGDVNSKILVIDGPPDAEEDKEGKSFILEKGELFDRILCSIELKKEDVFIVNGIPWRPPGNRYPTEKEIELCKPFIFKLINILKPKIILCLGEIAAKQILDFSDSIVSVRGKWYSLKNKFDPISNNITDNINILPTFSISYLIKRPDMKRKFWEDMKMLRSKIKEIKNSENVF